MVHRYCVGQKPATERYLADIRAKVSHLDNAIALEREQQKQTLAEVRQEIQKARLERTVAESREQMARITIATVEANYVARAQEILALQAEVTRLRNGLPVATQPAPAVSTVPTPEQISPAKEEATNDGTAIRFGLLEFD